MTNEEAICILQSIKHVGVSMQKMPGDVSDHSTMINTAIKMAIEALKSKPNYDILFLCDGKACGEDHDCMECRHTLDVCHAKNFHYNDVLFDKNYYLEADNEC